MWTRRLKRVLTRPAAAVDTSDVAAFHGVARRTQLLRLAFGGAALALVAAAAASARDLETHEQGLLPSGSTGVIVVDLSLSIVDEGYRSVDHAFRRLIAEDASIGLVVFSDVAYELLPPGTPASELRPILRLLVPPRSGTPVNPWTQTFRAGTRISTALELARSMLDRDHVENGSVLLVSDLETAPDDVPRLTSTLEGMRQDSISLHVVALGPSSDARQLFGEFLGADTFKPPSDPAAGDGQPLSREAVSKVPSALLLLGAFFFLALAAHELFAGRLRLPAPDRGHA